MFSFCLGKGLPQYKRFSFLLIPFSEKITNFILTPWAQLNFGTVFKLGLKNSN